MKIIKKHSESIVGKGENAGNQHFLLFPLYPIRDRNHKSSNIELNLSYANALNLVMSKIFCLVKS